MASGRTNCSTSSTTSDALHLQQTGHSTVLLGLPERSSFKCQHSMAKSITADLQGHGKSGELGIITGGRASILPRRTGIHGTQSKHHRRRSGSVCIDNVNWQAIQVGVRKFPESADVPIASICHRRIAATSGTTVTTWAATGAAKGVAKREEVDAKPCSDRGLGTGDRARKSGGSPKDKVGAGKVELDGHHPGQSSRQTHCSAHPGIFNVR
ncbi:uncharacterized protein BO88DRAFT_441893 [Aspergillus vadensis CBS 113365]|uniref:Uncharacterized protein n=1 Tax=Aspergillus vadensis (strain CBS 113365 / IMI 142717 / IBT 24658) TaxID=1448311 RepID=A0A319BJC3_ASPVC|nr:hypothetical protein BO88DRAFT_441893 [Aspergillus vadensis CBS 113365]PYH72334.1 hypothetical protein BO88DRAFT_441893 [Aspergillus vadensis CBS 113365]